MKNKQLFKELLTLIGEKYATEVSKSMAKLVWQALKPFPDEECKTAMEHIILYGRFYKDLLPDLMDRLEGSQNTKATEAWIKVDQAVKRVGNYASVRFDDPAIHSCIEVMGGWEALGQTSAHEWKWKQKEFEKLYSIMSRRQEHPDVLLGLCDRQNISRGFRKAPENIVQIGGSKDDLVSLHDARRPKAGPEPVAPKRRVGAGTG